MKEARRKHQMSEALPTVAFLTLSGGLQDAYTYFARGKVFANAQTGNIVLMAAHFAEGDPAGGMKYLIPVAAFALGVIAAEQTGAHFRMMQRLHWRQLIVAAEILILALVSFLPESMNLAANAMVSFVCAMQVQTFRKVLDSPYASTMCIGNLRGAMDHLSAFLRTRRKEELRESGRYLCVILLFALGAAIGCVSIRLVGTRAILVSCLLLAGSFLLMLMQYEHSGHQSA